MTCKLSPRGSDVCRGSNTSDAVPDSLHKPLATVSGLTPNCRGTGEGTAALGGLFRRRRRAAQGSPSAGRTGGSDPGKGRHKGGTAGASGKARAGRRTAGCRGRGGPARRLHVRCRGFTTVNCVDCKLASSPGTAPGRVIPERDGGGGGAGPSPPRRERGTAGSGQPAARRLRAVRAAKPREVWERRRGCDCAWSRRGAAAGAGAAGDDGPWPGRRWLVKEQRNREGRKLPDGPSNVKVETDFFLLLRPAKGPFGAATLPGVGSAPGSPVTPQGPRGQAEGGRLLCGPFIRGSYVNLGLPSPTPGVPGPSPTDAYVAAA